MTRKSSHAVVIELNHVPNNYDPRPSMTLLADVLERAGFAGTWQAAPTRQCSWRSPGRFKVMRIARHSLLIKLKPDDNGSCWDWELQPPATIGLLSALQRLQDWNDYDGLKSPKTARRLSRAAANAGPDPVPQLDEDEENAEITEIQVVETPKPAVVPGVSPPTVSVGARVAEMEAAATYFRSRQQQINQLRQTVENKLREADELEHEANELQAAHDGDARGKAAIDTLAALQKFITA